MFPIMRNQKRAAPYKSPRGQASSSTLTPPPDWKLHNTTLRPTPPFVHRLNTFLSSQQTDDLIIRFTFPSTYSHPALTIHQSRLSFAQGPLRALTERDFVEQATREVTLSEQDDPATFMILRDFLYAKEVRLDFGLEAVLKVVRAAHRWELMELFRNALGLIREKELLSNGTCVLQAVDIVALPDVSDEFKTFFWERVGRHFDEFGHVEGKEVKTGRLVKNVNLEDGGVESRFCPRFVELWPSAAAQEMVEVVMRSILKYSKKEGVVRWLLEVILIYLEPRIQNGKLICDLISLLSLEGALTNEDYVAVAERGELDTSCSVRAMRLLVKSVVSPKLVGQEMRHVWRWNVGRGEMLSREAVYINDNGGKGSKKGDEIALRRARIFGEAEAEEFLQSSIRFRVGSFKEDKQNGVRVTWGGSGGGGVFRKIRVGLEVWAEGVCLKRTGGEFEMVEGGALRFKLGGDGGWSASGYGGVVGVVLTVCEVDL